MADNIISRLEDLTISPEHVSVDKLIDLIAGLHISQVTRPSHRKIIVFPRSLLKFIRAVDNLVQVESLIRGLFRRGHCTIGDWWKILVIVDVMIKIHPELESQISSLVIKIVCSGFIFESV